nr:hypothetical protein L204_05990 [Cryptococcus depauperatus CBS 7855]
MFNSPSIRSQRFGTPVKGTQPSARSRLQTLRPNNHSPTPSIAETARTEKPVDNKEKLYLNKDDRHTVTTLGKLPDEVAYVIKQSVDFVIDPISADVNPDCGFATVSTPRSVTCWNYSKRTHSTPTIYTFPAPVPTSSPARYLPPVLSALYTSSTASEPGMILVSSGGEVRFWDTVSLALSDVERYHYLSVELAEDDWVEQISKIDSSNFILTTTSSQAYRLRITSSAGRLLPEIIPFQRSGGLFGRLSSVLFSGKDDKEGIKSIAVVEGREAYLLAQKSLSKFIITNEGQKFVLEYDLYNTIGNSLYDEWSTGEVSLTIEDIVPSSAPNSFYALVTLTPSPKDTSYALISLSLGKTVEVTDSIPIAYHPPRETRTLDVPRLLVPYQRSLAFVRFGSVVVMIGLDHDFPYEELMTLKDSRNAYLGGSIVEGGGLNIVLFPAEGGLMGVEVFEPRPVPDSLKLSVDRLRCSAATARTKTKIEQAIFFSRNDNPLSFDIPSDQDLGDVSEAAELVSAGVISSQSQFATPITALRAQLSDRLSRLVSLIRFLGTNHLLNKVGQASRRRLSRDAEKVKGGLELWDYQDKLMDQMAEQPHKSLLSSSIDIYFSSSSVSSLPDTDFDRLFFKTQLTHLDKLLEIVFETFTRHMQQLETSGYKREQACWLAEVNSIYIMVERAAARYREEESDSYEINRETPSIEMWTASDPLLNSLEYLYTTTERVIEERTRELGSAVDEATLQQQQIPGNEELRKEQILQGQLKRQMGWLAAALCANMEDKCRVSVRQMEDDTNEEEGIRLKARWDAMKPRVIRPLVSVDRISEAFELAEHHRDFPTLVVLCQNPVASKGKGNNYIQNYIEKFGEDFAFELYQWFIDQAGRPYDLLTQDEVYSSLLTKFFEVHLYPELAWIHHIACKRYSSASNDLFTVLCSHGDEKSDLELRKVVGSIGKLTSMADVVRGTSKEDTTFQQISQQLSLIDIQTSLRTWLLSLLPSRSSLKQLPKHINPHISLLSSRPALSELFLNLTERLVMGEAIDVEGIVDLLNLKDNFSREDDAVEALRVLILDKTLPKARSEVALISAWRRIYIRDNWTLISNTAGRSEQAQREKLERTLTYYVLNALRHISDFPSAAIISPYDASIPPTELELTARFSRSSIDYIKRLHDSHEEEVRLLMCYVDENGLEERVEEIKKMIAEGNGNDIEEQSDVDVEM